EAMRLTGKAVVVGVSGGIACYKACEVVRLLVTAGARVRVVMTAAAQRFVAPLTFQTLAGQPVATDTFDLTQESEIGHIRLADEADAIAIAPATANVIAKLATGLADDLLMTVLLVARAPLVLAPAMNVHMWEHPTVQENLARLVARGASIVGPESGWLACGYEGTGRLADPEDVVEEILRVLAPKDLAAQRVLVSAGAHRSRPLPLEPLEWEDGLRDRTGGAAAGSRGDAGQRPDGAATPSRRPHGVGHHGRGDGARRPCRLRERQRRDHGRGRRGLPPAPRARPKAQEDRPAAHPRARGERGHPSPTVDPQGTPTAGRVRRRDQ